MHPSRTKGAANGGMAAAERGLRGGAVEGAGGRRWAEVAEVCSLVKVLLGCGIFSLSGACAVVGDDPRILLPASALTLFFAATAGYTFLLLGRAAAAAPLGVASVGEIWAAHVSEESAWVPELLSSALTWSVASIQAVIIASTGQEILRELLSTLNPQAPALRVEAFLTSRAAVLGAVAAVFLLPASLTVRDPKWRVRTSALGNAAILYTLIFTGVRALDGTYAEGGCFWKTLPLDGRPSFGRTWGAATSWSLLLAVLNTCQMAHFDAPRLYHSLSSQGKDIDAFRRVCLTAFLTAGIIAVLIMAGGFWTFGGSTAALLSSSYHPSDPLALAARAATLLSVATAYPLVCSAFARQAINLSPTLPGPPEHHQTMATLVTVASSVTVGILCSNLGKVSGVTGAFLGSALIYAIPAILFVSSRPYARGKVQRKWGREEWLAVLVGTAGSALGLLNAAQVLRG